MKNHELRDLSIDELQAREKDAAEALHKLAFDQAVTGQVENPARFKQYRREIARLKTIIHEKRTA